MLHLCYSSVSPVTLYNELKSLLYSCPDHIQDQFFFSICLFFTIITFKFTICIYPSSYNYFSSSFIVKITKNICISILTIIIIYLIISLPKFYILNISWNISIIIFFILLNWIIPFNLSDGISSNFGYCN